MENVLIIGAGAAGAVVAKKCAMNRDIFKQVHLASRTLSRCQAVQKQCKSEITVSEIDAEDVAALTALIKRQKSDIVINMALGYQNLAIMDACLEAGAHYIDTACSEVRNKAGFTYETQWPYHERFREKGLMAVLGCGFDPGVTNIYCAYAQENLMDEIHYVDIIDCNDGNHGKAFATNFNTEINIREITARGRYWKNGEWVGIDPLSTSRMIDFPGVGLRKGFLIYHEEEESLVHNLRGLKQIRFWMTFSDNYIKHLDVLQNVGMTRIDPVIYKGVEIVPLQFLAFMLPDPSSLAINYTGKTSIGCIMHGIKDGKPVSKIIYNNSDHAVCNDEIGSQAVSYTAGVPAMTAALVMMKGLWTGKGVFNAEQLPSKPFLEEVARQGLPWHVKDVTPGSESDIPAELPAA